MGIWQKRLESWQDCGTPKSKSIKPRSTRRCDTLYLSEEVLWFKAIDDKLEWMRTKAGDEKGLADDEGHRGLRKVPRDQLNKNRSSWKTDSLLANRP